MPGPKAGSSHCSAMSLLCVGRLQICHGCLIRLFCEILSCRNGSSKQLPMLQRKDVTPIIVPPIRPLTDHIQASNLYLGNSFSVWLLFDVA